MKSIGRCHGVKSANFGRYLPKKKKKRKKLAFALSLVLITNNVLLRKKVKWFALKRRANP